MGPIKTYVSTTIEVTYRTCYIRCVTLSTSHIIPCSDLILQLKFSFLSLDKINAFTSET